jgi:hypothetical protein
MSGPVTYGMGALRPANAWIWLPGILMLLSGCVTNDMLVMQLDTAVRDAALKTQEAAGDAVTVFRLELNVINAVDAGVTVPVTPVTIGSKVATQFSSKLVVEIDMKAFREQEEQREKARGTADGPELFVLDTRTGELRSGP